MRSLFFLTHFLSQTLLTHSSTVSSIDLRGTSEVPLEIRSKSGIHGEAVHKTEDEVIGGVEVVVKTPGTEAFEKMFLERVYGA